MQRIRLEENTVRFLVLLVIAIIDGVVIFPLVQIDAQVDSVITVAMVGVCSLVSWKMFSRGAERGTDLFGHDLNSISKTLSQTITHLREETASMENDHRDDAQSIQASMNDFAEKLELDKKIQDYAQDSARQEIEEHTLQIHRYCDETLDMCKNDNEEIADRVVKRVTELLEEKKNGTNYITQDKVELNTDNTDKINSKEIAAKPSSGPTNTQKPEDHTHGICKFF